MRFERVDRNTNIKVGCVSVCVRDGSQFICDNATWSSRSTDNTVCGWLSGLAVVSNSFYIIGSFSPTRLHCDHNAFLLCDLKRFVLAPAARMISSASGKNVEIPEFIMPTNVWVGQTECTVSSEWTMFHAHQSRIASMPYWSGKYAVWWTIFIYHEKPLDIYEFILFSAMSFAWVCIYGIVAYRRSWYIYMVWLDHFIDCVIPP